MLCRHSSQMMRRERRIKSEEGTVGKGKDEEKGGGKK